MFEFLDDGVLYVVQAGVCVTPRIRSFSSLLASLSVRVLHHGYLPQLLCFVTLQSSLEFWLLFVLLVAFKRAVVFSYVWCWFRVDYRQWSLRRTCVITLLGVLGMYLFLYFIGRVRFILSSLPFSLLQSVWPTSFCCFCFVQDVVVF